MRLASFTGRFLRKGEVGPGFVRRRRGRVCLGLCAVSCWVGCGRSGLSELRKVGRLDRPRVSFVERVLLGKAVLGPAEQLLIGPEASELTQHGVPKSCRVLFAEHRWALQNAG